MSNEVRVDIKATEDVSAAIDRVVAKLQKLKNKKIDINIDSASAIREIEALDKRIKALSGRKIDVNVDTAAARFKVQHLKDRIDELGKTTPKVDIDTRVARDKVRYLINRIKEISLAEAKVNLDTKGALAQIAALKLALKNLSGERITVEADKNLKVKVEMDKDHFERNAKAAFNELNKADNRAKIKMDVDDDHLGGSLQKVLNKLGKAEVRQKVKIEIDDANLENSLKRALTRMGKAEVRQKIKIEVDQDVFEYSLNRALGQLGKKEYRKTVKVEVDQDNFGRSLATAVRTVGKQEVRQTVKLDIDEFHLEQKLNRALKGINTTSADRRVKINVDVDDDLAKLIPAASAIRLISRMDDKHIKIKIETDIDNDFWRISAVLSDVNRTIGRSSRGISNSSNAIKNAIGSIGGDGRRGIVASLSSLFSRGVLGVASAGMNGIASGARKFAEAMASATTRIPAIGGMFKGISALGGAGGPITAAVAGILAAGAALTMLGTVGVAGTGAITAGAYALTGALGAVAGAAGVVSGVLSAGVIGGFAYLATQTVPEVKDSLDRLVDHVRVSMEGMSKNVAPGTISFFDSLKEAFIAMEPSINRVSKASNELLTQLSTKMTPIADSLGVAFEKIFATGAKHLNVIVDNLPGIVDGLGDMFETLGSPAMIEATNSVLGSIPGIIRGIGDAINWSASSFNQLKDFLNSENMTPLREGLRGFMEEMKTGDWSEASEGIANAMNSFGDFVGSIEAEDIAGTIGSISDGLANLADVAEKINLMGIFNGMSKAFEGITAGIEGMVDIITAKVNAVIGPAKSLWNTIFPDKTPKFDVDIEPTMNVERLSGALSKLKRDDYVVPLQPQITGLKDEGRWGALVAQMADMTIPVGVIPQIDSEASLLDVFAGVETVIDVIPEIKNAPNLQTAIDQLKGKMEVTPELAANTDVQALLGAMEGVLRVNPEFSGGFAEMIAFLESQQAVLEVTGKLNNEGFMNEALSQINGIVNMYPQLQNAESIPALLAGIKGVLGITPELADPAALQSALDSLDASFKARVEVNPNSTIESFRTLLEGQIVNIKAQPNADPAAIANMEAQLAALNFIMKVNPAIEDTTSIKDAIGALEAIMKVSPQLNDTQSIFDAISALQAIMKVFPEMDPASVGELISALSGQKIGLDTELKPPGAIPDIGSALGKILIDSAIKPPAELPIFGPYPVVQLDSEIKPPDTSKLGSLGLKVDPPVEVPATPKFQPLDSSKLLQNGGKPMELPVTPVPAPQGQGRAFPDLNIGTPPKLPVTPDVPAGIQPFANMPAQDVPATPDFSAANVATDAIPPIEVQIIPKFDGAMANGVIPPLDVQIVPKFEGAVLNGVIPPLPVQIQPLFEGAVLNGVIPPLPVQIIPKFDGVTTGMVMIPPIPVQIIPKFDGVGNGMVMIDPIPVQIIPQFDGAAGFGLIPPLPVQIIPQFNMAGVMIPPIMVPVILQMPPTPTVNITVTSNIGDIAGQIAAIPGAVGTTHTVTSNVLEITAQVNAIPKETATTHTVTSNVSAVLGQIMSLNGQNTSSTHTVNIVTNGSLPSGGGGTGIAGGIMGMAAPAMMGISSVAGIADSGLMGATGATGLSSSFNFTPKSSKSSLLMITNAVKSSVTGAWYDLGESTIQSFGKGFSKGSSITFDSIMETVGNGFGVVGEFLDGVINGDAIFGLNLNDIMTVVEAIQTLVDAIPAEDMNKMIDEFNKMEVRPRADDLSNAFSSVVDGINGAFANFGIFDIDKFLAKPFTDVESFVQAINDELTRIGDIPVGAVSLGTLLKKPMDDVRGFIAGVQGQIANLKNMQFGAINIETILTKPAMDMQAFIRGISEQLKNVGAVSIETIMAKPLADLQAFIDGVNNQFNTIRNAPQSEIVAKPVADVQSFLSTLGVPHVPVKIEPDKEDAQKKVENAVDGAKVDVDVPKDTNSLHQINTNIAEVIAQIDGLNNRNTQSTHTITVAVNGGGLLGGMGIAMPAVGAMPAMAGISEIGDLSGTMGIAGAAGLEGASGVTGDFSFSKTSSNSSFLLISTAVRSAILDSWKGLGNQTAQVYTLGFAEGVENARANVAQAVAGLTNVSIPGSLSSSGAYAAGKLTAMSYADGLNSSIGAVETVGVKLGNVVQIGTSLSKDMNWWGLNLSEGMFAFGKGIQSLTEFIPRVGSLFTGGGLLNFMLPTNIPFLSEILGAAFKIIPVIGKLANGLITAAGYWVQNMSNPFNGKGVVQYNYYHYETTTNNFDGGLVGNPEEQARRVLDVLEQSPSTRRIRRVFGTENV